MLARLIAAGAGACDRWGVSSDQRPPPTLSEVEEPAIRPLEFVIAEDADGQRTVDVRESEFEQVYNLQDPYSCLMFVALCRREGVMVYRRARQRTVTVCVKTTVSKHNALWERFLILSKRFDARLAEVTQQFVRDELEAGSR